MDARGGDFPYLSQLGDAARKLTKFQKRRKRPEFRQGWKNQ